MNNNSSYTGYSLDVLQRISEIVSFIVSDHVFVEQFVFSNLTQQDTTTICVLEEK